MSGDTPVNDGARNFIELLTDEQLDALYDEQYGAHSTVHQVYQAGRGDLPDLCLSCATEQAIEREQARRGAR